MSLSTVQHMDCHNVASQRVVLFHIQWILALSIVSYPDVVKAAECTNQSDNAKEQDIECDYSSDEDLFGWLRSETLNMWLSCLFIVTRHFLISNRVLIPICRS